MSQTTLMLLSLLLLLAGCDTTSSPIAGSWKHADKPAWVKIEFVEGIGSASILKHENNPDANGQLLLSEIKTANRATNSWVGKMYSAAADSFVDVSLMLRNDDTIVIRTAAPDQDPPEEQTEVLLLIRS